MAKRETVHPVEVPMIEAHETFIRNAYNYSKDAVSLATGLVCGPSLAHQSFAEECDINTIVKRFGITGKLPTAVRMPTFGDFTGVQDYQSALHAIMEAEDSFMKLPADLRARFENDPQRFVEFCSDDANLPEARRMGLVPPEEVPATPPASPPAVSSSAAPAKP